MQGYMKIIAMGNITKTPELKTTKGGKSVCKFTLAINQPYTKTDGSKVENTKFPAIECWNKVAENVCKHKNKGDAVMVEARDYEIESWVSKTDGTTKFALKIKADNVKFLPSKDGSNGNTDPSTEAGIPDEQDF